MSKKCLTLLVFAAASLSGWAAADELTKIIQQDLETLGYTPGSTDGEATVQTAIAISKFQAEHDLEVTGEASPQLAGIIKAAIKQDGRGAAASGPPAAPAASAARAAPAAAGAPASAPPPSDAAALRAAQQACLQRKVAEAQQSQQRKRGFARLARAVGRTASRLGGNDVASDVAELSADVYDANAIASDFQGAAEDLGLTESDIEACRNP